MHLIPGEIESLFNREATSQMKSAQGQAGGLPPLLVRKQGACASATAFAHLQDRRRRQLNVFFSRRPVRYGDAHRSHAVPDGTAKPAGPILLNTLDHRGGKSICVATSEEE